MTYMAGASVERVPVLGHRSIAKGHRGFGHITLDLFGEFVARTKKTNCKATVEKLGSFLKHAKRHASRN
jgi:hypothetical protein